MKKTIVYLFAMLCCAACSSPTSPKTVENMIGTKVKALTFDSSPYWEGVIQKAQTAHIKITMPTNGTGFPLKAHHAPISIQGKYYNPDVKVAQLMLRVYTNAQKSSDEEAFFRGFMPAKPIDDGFALDLSLTLPWQTGLFYYVIEEHKSRAFIAGGKFEVREATE